MNSRKDLQAELQILNRAIKENTPNKSVENDNTFKLDNTSDTTSCVTVSLSLCVYTLSPW